MLEQTKTHFDEVDREARDFLISLFQRFLDAEISQYDFEDILSEFLLARAGCSSWDDPKKRDIIVYEDMIIYEVHIWVQAVALSIGPVKLIGDWALVDSTALAQASRIMLFLKSDRPYLEPPFRRLKSIIFASLLNFLRRTTGMRAVSKQMEEAEKNCWDPGEYREQCWPFFSLEDYSAEQKRQGISD
jgi:hypothetical protein